MANRNLKKKINIQQHQIQLSNLLDKIHHNAKNLHSDINKQKQIRSSLDEYLNKGQDALKKTNQMLKDLGNQTCFGCNALILVVIAFFTLIFLALI